jgi:hypothetical protein
MKQISPQYKKYGIFNVKAGGTVATTTDYNVATIDQ